MYFITLAGLCFLLVTTGMASHTNTLSHRLQRVDVNVNTISCQCIMSKPDKNNTDNSTCMCFNRKNGTSNATKTCRAYLDGVFSFCSDVTEGTELWQECVQHYCPRKGDITIEPPRDRIYF